MRHNLVQQIIRAYEEFDAAHPQRGGVGRELKREESGEWRAASGEKEEERKKKEREES